MKRYHLALILIFCFFLVFLSPIIHGQESPFIPEKLSAFLNNEISGDRAFEYIRWLSHYHRIMGSNGFLEAAKLLSDFSQDFGLENIRVVKQKFEGGTSWDPVSGELWIVEPEIIKLCNYEEVPVSLAVFSHSTHVEAELVDVGRGRSGEDFKGTDISGKVVLTSSAPSLATRTAVWQRGALGVISSYNIRPSAIHDSPDQVAYMKVPTGSPKGKAGAWAFMISPRQRTMLQDLLRKARAKKQSVKVKIDIETKFREPAEQAYVWAEIRGSEIHNQDIVLTAHLDEEKTSANDNGSGCASILEIGRTITSLIKNGKIPRPKRDIIFWWPNEHTSEYQFFKEHPEERKNMLININQDMVGAKQSMGSRVQHIARTPASIPSYLSDVIESITEYVILSNTAFLAVRQAGGPYPFSKPILSFLGTRERYNAMVIPHSSASDHEVFCEGIIGIPGVGLGNNPDPYIHSSADDLDNIDQTQLKRNAFIVAATALFVASAGDEEVPLIAAEVYSRGLQRIGKDLSAGLHHIRGKKGGSFQQTYKEAKNLIRQALIRESKAMASVLVFAEQGGQNEAYVKRLIKKIRAMESDLVRDLDALYLLVSGDEEVPSMKLTAEENEMASRIPINIDSVDEYFRKRGYFVRADGLHPLICKECYNFVDGKNSYLDIFNAVHAEAMSVGQFYYGEVSLKDVKKLLDKAVKKGILELK